MILDRLAAISVAAGAIVLLGGVGGTQPVHVSLATASSAAFPSLAGSRAGVGPIVSVDGMLRGLDSR